MRNEQRSNLDRLIGLLARSAPILDPPPFFAARIGALIQSESRMLFFPLLQRTAQQLVPLFLALIAVTTFLLYQSGRRPADTERGFELLFEQPFQAELVTLEDVLNSLGPIAGEDGNGEK